MFGSVEFRQDHGRPKTDWAREARQHLDSLPVPVTARDLSLLETAAQGRVTWQHEDRMRVCELLAGVRDGYRNVAIDGQAALLAEVRARVETPCEVGRHVTA